MYEVWVLDERKIGIRYGGGCGHVAMIPLQQIILFLIFCPELSYKLRLEAIAYSKLTLVLSGFESTATLK